MLRSQVSSDSYESYSEEARALGMGDRDHKDDIGDAVSVTVYFLFNVFDSLICRIDLKLGVIIMYIICIVIIVDICILFTRIFRYLYWFSMF